jgi:hypothetical protein
MSIRSVPRLAAAPVLTAPEGSMILYSYSQNPNVPNNPNPIYAVGSPQYLAAMAAGAIDPHFSGRSYFVASPAFSPFAASPLNPAQPVAVASMPSVIGAPASLSGRPWYYYAGGVAAVLLLLNWKGIR